MDGSFLNAAHLHIAINHLPVIGFMAALVLAICAMFIKDRMLHMTAWMFTVGCAATAVVSYLTGEPAEEMIAGTPGVSDAFMSAHMRWGQWTYWATIGVGAISLLGWFIVKRKADADRKWMAFLIVMLLAANVLGAITASLGGDIRHTEIHGDKSEQMLKGFALQPEEREMLESEPKWSPPDSEDAEAHE
jgi:uncharacterized membrane protein